MKDTESNGPASLMERSARIDSVTGGQDQHPEIDTASPRSYNTPHVSLFSISLSHRSGVFRMIGKGLLDIQERYGYLPQEELEFLALRRP
jgi:hypothetical protein